MLSSERINEIHRLYHAERWSMRKIARHLRLAPKTVKKYLLAPAQTPGSHSRASKLDPFKLTLTELLQQDPSASAVVLLQRLRPLGYEGGITILRDYVSPLRAKIAPPRAFVRMEPGPGERFEIDWGHSTLSTIRATSASSMPSAWSSATAACSTSSSLTARASRPSSAATSMPSRR